jgi:hypothetical protein
MLWRKVFAFCFSPLPITLSTKEPFIATYCYRSGNILAIIVPNRASGSCPDPEILGTGSRKVYEGAAA